jgi:chromosome partitioning protein
MKGNQLDADEAVNVIKVIRSQFRRAIPFRVFLSQISPVIMDRGMRDICAQMRDNSIPMLRTGMVERSAFKVPFRLGGTIYDLSERKASQRIGCVRVGDAYLV